jgi:hypothetical protein
MITITGVFTLFLASILLKLFKDFSQPLNVGNPGESK